MEKSNWTGLCIVFPRSQFAEARRRDELNRTGVYVLWGPGESGQFPRIYVGMSDSVLSRLDHHAKHKDFWTHAVVFTSKDQNLNKAHVEYIEARLIQIARKTKRAELDNSNDPKDSPLSEADKADAEAFLEDMLLCLPIVGLNVFEIPKAGQTHSKDLILRAGGIEAKGQEADEGFIVRKGSQAVKKEVPSCPTSLIELRSTLEKQGVFEDAGDFFRLTQDYIFSSPSTAAGVLLGRTANGRQEWKDERGRPLREIQGEESKGS